MAISDVDRTASESKGARNSVLSLGNVSLDLRSFRLAVMGQFVELRYHELELLKLLMNQPDHVIGYEEIMSALWGTTGTLTRRGLNVLVCRLRAKLAGSSPYAIETVRGRGYGLLKPYQA